MGRTACLPCEISCEQVRLAGKLPMASGVRGQCHSESLTLVPAMPSLHQYWKIVPTSCGDVPSAQRRTLGMTIQVLGTVVEGATVKKLPVPHGRCLTPPHGRPRLPLTGVILSRV